MTYKLSNNLWFTAMSRVLCGLALVLASWWLPTRAVAVAAPSVGVYVNIEELAALWPHRNGDTGQFPQKGEPGYEAYRSQWQLLITEAFTEIRKRVPRSFNILPITGPDQNFDVKLEVWIADMRTTCNSPDAYKYLWVKSGKGDGVVSNWDGLGVRSNTLISLNMAPHQRLKANTDSWTELWAQVPYLHLNAAPEELTGDSPGDG